MKRHSRVDEEKADGESLAGQTETHQATLDYAPPATAQPLPTTSYESSIYLIDKEAASSQRALP